MNKLFKDIRRSGIEAVQATILKSISVVSEVYNARAPKEDIGQLPLQVAVKRGKFGTIELLLENEADSSFMEDPALVPPYSVYMSVLRDAIIDIFSSLCYKQCGHPEKYIYLAEKLFENGANPNRKTSPDTPLISTAVNRVEMISERKKVYPDIQEIVKKRLFEVLDLLIGCGVDQEKWLDQNFWGVLNKVHFFEEKAYDINNIDIREPIRIALGEYFD